MDEQLKLLREEMMLKDEKRKHLEFLVAECSTKLEDLTVRLTEVVQTTSMISQRMGKALMIQSNFP